MKARKEDDDDDAALQAERELLEAMLTLFEIAKGTGRSFRTK